MPSEEDAKKLDEQSFQSVSIVISEVVQSGRIEEYEEWVNGINTAAKEFDGFIGVDVIRPRDPHFPEYVAIVRFNSLQNLEGWRKSSTCLVWLEKSKDFIAREVHFPQSKGVEMWFSLPPNSPAFPPQPPYHKLVIVGTLGVYPLILLVDALLSPFLLIFPPFLRVFISVVVVSMLVTYPVMPLLTHLLRFWLYPSSPEK
jgi:hypothetical protein